MKHTPEPWTVRNGTIVSEATNLILLGHYCDERGKADVARAAQCVNACAGMEDPAEEIQRLRAALTPNDPAQPAATATAALSMEELGRLSEHMDDYMHWAQVWHRQAGGYTASDTVITILRMERWARQLQEITGKPSVPLRRINAVGRCAPEPSQP